MSVRLCMCLCLCSFVIMVCTALCLYRYSITMCLHQIHHSVPLLLQITDNPFLILGAYVTLVLTDVPKRQAEQLVSGSRVVSWFSLFRHEVKTSVLNFTVQRSELGANAPEDVKPIKSKDELIFMVNLRVLTMY